MLPLYGPDGMFLERLHERHAGFAHYKTDITGTAVTGLPAGTVTAAHPGLGSRLWAPWVVPAQDRRGASPSFPQPTAPCPDCFTPPPSFPQPPKTSRELPTGPLPV